MGSTLFFVPNTKGPISDNQVLKETTEDTLSEDGFRKKNLWETELSRFCGKFVCYHSLDSFINH